MPQLSGCYTSKTQQPRACPGLLLKHHNFSLATRHDEVATPVLLITVLGGFAALRAFFSIADRVHPAGINSERNQVVFHRIGSPITKAAIVFLAATFVAMTFNAELDAGIGHQEACCVGESCLLIVANIGLVIVEIHVTNILDEFLFERLRRTSRWRGWWRRRSRDGDSCCGGRAATFSS